MTEIVRAQSANDLLRYKDLGVGIQDMFNIVERNQGWEKFKIDSPKTYFGYTQKISHFKSKDKQRGHYLNDLYRQTKHVPGVGKYEMNCFPQKFKSASHKLRPVYRKTYLDEIIDQQNRQARPGPGNYFKKKKNSTDQKKEEDKMPAAQRGTYLDEVEYLATKSPGIGQYNISTQIVKKSFGVTKTRQEGRIISKKTGSKSLQKINPTLEGTFDFIRTSKRKKNSTFGKDKRFKLDTEHAKVPSPQHYNLKRVWSATKADHFTNQISTRPMSGIYH